MKKGYCKTGKYIRAKYQKEASTINIDLAREHASSKMVGYTMAAGSTEKLMAREQCSILMAPSMKETSHKELLREISKYMYMSYQYSTGEMYEGDVQHWKRNGNGTMTYKNGDKYKGKWSNDKREGEGTIEFAEGGKFNGPFFEDSITGVGSYIDKKGNKFSTANESSDGPSGKFENGKLGGTAELFCTNGTRYFGQYQCGKCHGKGKLTLVVEKYGSTVQIEYIGMFKCNMRSGKGRMDWKDSTCLDGNWISDILYQGTLKMINGMVN